MQLIGTSRDYANAPEPVQNVVFLCKEVKIYIYRIMVFTVVLYGRSRHRWEDNIKVDPKATDSWAWTGQIWLRKGTNVRMLCIR